MRLWVLSDLHLELSPQRQLQRALDHVRRPRHCVDRDPSAAERVASNRGSCEGSFSQQRRQ